MPGVEVLRSSNPCHAGDQACLDTERHPLTPVHPALQPITQLTAHRHGPSPSTRRHPRCSYNHPRKPRAGSGHRHAADPRCQRRHAQGSAERKPRPVTYRLYPSDRPRLDAFRIDPKQSQADNLQGVIDLLENASAALQAQEQTQAQLEETSAKLTQAEAEREQARQEAQGLTQETAGLKEHVAAQEQEIQRLQAALAQEQKAHRAAAAASAAGGGSPVVQAVLARELLALATSGECQGELHGPADRSRHPRPRRGQQRRAPARKNVRRWQKERMHRKRSTIPERSPRSRSIKGGWGSCLPRERPAGRQVEHRERPQRRKRFRSQPA